jgi:hypothetical protein
MKMNDWLGAFVLSALALTAAAQPDLSKIRPRVEKITEGEMERVGQQSGLTSCFWLATVSPSTFNILIPDSGVVYWVTQYRLPAGASLSLRGQFPKARHISLNTYDEAGQPVDRLNDLMMEPDAGSTNPFRPHARRDAAQRDYQVRLTQAAVTAGARVNDASRPANTLYAPQGSAVQLWYRVYVPDQGADLKGSVPLPVPVLQLADGRRLEGDAVCGEIVVKEGALRDVRVPTEALKPLFALPGATSAYHPAQNPPSWNAFFNAPLSATNLLIGTPHEAIRARLDATRRGGFYSTLDNTYMSAYVDSRFGEVLVIKGKAPTTPRTFAGGRVMEPAQLRYWSLCKYRSLSDTAVDSCLYDEQVPLAADGSYTIVMSSAAQRPANATAKCGVAWLDWGQGDGIGNPAGGFLAFRHMMPAPDFAQSLFATRKPGDEASTLGPYYPASAYSSRTAFEKQGCQARDAGAESNSGIG